MPPHEPSAFPKNLPDPKLPPAVEIDEILTSIQHSHSFYYKVMNLEVWALVETLDGLFPGAWGQFMTNRQLAVKQFLERDRVPNSPVDAGDARDKSDDRRQKEEARSQESERSRKKQEEE
ncbi:hypothetical protein QUA42_01295 [Microcoleus sp. Pol11C2]|uniref:hypothetical protein n=1 Tax=Microcoleus sp. Pol11C2 TaxID=3055389 RepID=UPI002FD5360F